MLTDTYVIVFATKKSDLLKNKLNASTLCKAFWFCYYPVEIWKYRERL